MFEAPLMIGAFDYEIANFAATIWARYWGSALSTINWSMQSDIGFS
jgi:hypothetical protein